MYKTVFVIPKMDCPSEEQLIQMKLGEIAVVKQLGFDLENRTLIVIHEELDEKIEKYVQELNLGGELVSTEAAVGIALEEQTNQRRILIIVLVINFLFFLVEATTGILSHSMGLIADSLDMLADALVYGISLFAVGGTVARKKNTAKLAGYFQLLLACIGFTEVLRRFFYAATPPDFITMIIVSIFALLANGACLYLLQQSRNKEEAHMKASVIFTSNDIIINVGVITAGVLVYLLDSNYPDLVIGTIVFALVIQGAFRILKLGK